MTVTDAAVAIRLVDDTEVGGVSFVYAGNPPAASPSVGVMEFGVDVRRVIW